MNRFDYTKIAQHLNIAKRNANIMVHLMQSLGSGRFSDAYDKHNSEDVKVTVDYQINDVPVITAQYASEKVSIKVPAELFAATTNELDNKFYEWYDKILHADKLSKLRSELRQFSNLIIQEPNSIYAELAKELLELNSLPSSRNRHLALDNVINKVTKKLELPNV